MKQLLKPIAVLTLIAFVCTAALAGVNLLTRDIIRISEEKAAQAAMHEMLEDPKGFETLSVSEELLKQYHVQSVCRAKSGLGYIVQSSAKGYGGEMRLMLSFSPTGEVLSLRVLSHEETNGVGTRAVESREFLDRFCGKNAAQGGEIAAVAGATVSSTAVVNAVNGAANFLIAAGLAAGE